MQYEYFARWARFTDWTSEWLKSSSKMDTLPQYGVVFYTDDVISQRDCKQNTKGNHKSSFDELRNSEQN